VDPDAFEDESVSQVATFLAGAGLLAAVVSFAFGDSVDLTTVLMGGTLLVVVMARQAWTLRINTRMTSQLRADIDQLAQQAQRDALTGLPNRVGLDDRIVAASRKATARDRTAAVMFVDLDHLKTVNDSLGHAAGDQLITTMANRLTARVGDRVTRFGGDEFVIVLDDLADEEALDHVAEAVVADGTRTIDLGGIELRPSVSVGAAVMDLSTPPAELLRQMEIRPRLVLRRHRGRGRRGHGRWRGCDGCGWRRGHHGCGRLWGRRGGGGPALRRHARGLARNPFRHDLLVHDTGAGIAHDDRLAAATRRRRAGDRRGATGTAGRDTGTAAAALPHHTRTRES
jgi:diguanylate cyclase (GGDEF)-like protein